MRKILLSFLFILLPTYVYAHGVGRYCSNSYCMMCNRLHLKHGHKESVSRLTYNSYRELHAKLHEPEIDSTPQEVVEGMLKLVNPTKDDVLYDLGCGDGRFLITAAKKYSCQVVGIEINPQVAKIAERNIQAAGVDARVIVGDATKYDLSGATIITMYLFPDVMRELKITHATRIISYSHTIPGRKNKRLLINGKYPVYLWVKITRPTGEFL